MKSTKPDNNKGGEKNASETEYDWQMNGWRSSRLHARSQIKKFNIFRYPFYTCCVALVVDACQLLLLLVCLNECEERRRESGSVSFAWTFSPCRSRCWLGCSFHACELFLCASFFDYFPLAPLRLSGGRLNGKYLRHTKRWLNGEEAMDWGGPKVCHRAIEANSVMEKLLIDVIKIWCRWGWENVRSGESFRQFDYNLAIIDAVRRECFDWLWYGDTGNFGGRSKVHSDEKVCVIKDQVESLKSGRMAIRRIRNNRLRGSWFQDWLSIFN